MGKLKYGSVSEKNNGSMRLYEKNNGSMCLYEKNWYNFNVAGGPSWSLLYGSWINNYLCNQCLSPLKLRVLIPIRARCTTLYDKVYQWLTTWRWFTLGPPVSSTNKTYLHDIIEILLKVALNKSKIILVYFGYPVYLLPKTFTSFDVQLYLSRLYLM